MEADTFLEPGRDNVTYVLIVGCDAALFDELKTTLEAGGRVHAAFAHHLKDAFESIGGYTPDFVVVQLSSAILPGFKSIPILPALQPTTVFSIAMFQREYQRGQIAPRLSVTAESLTTQLHAFFDSRSRRRLSESRLERYWDDVIRADFIRNEFKVGRRRFSLVPREQEVLRILLERVDEVVTRDQIYRQLWGYPTRSLDVHIRRLRAKLGSASRQVSVVKGFGYRFVPAGEAHRKPRERT